MISEIYIQVSFLKHTLLKKDSGVVEGDYNTTKLVFRFDEDVSGKRIVFQMSDPQGDIVMITELNASHEVMLAGTDSEGNVCTLFNEPGLYPFELVMYDTDAKLTSAPGWLTVNKQQVDIDNQIVEAYIPFFDDLLREVGEALQKVESLESSFNNTFSNALKGSKSGSVILIDDVSPVTHEMGVKVRGKNLFNINGFINLTGNSTCYGINDNGELYVKQSDFRDDTVIPAFVTLEAGTYTLSSTTPITSNFKLINLTDNTVISYNNNITFSIEKATSLGIKCWQAADTVIGKLQLELGTTATAYTPYVDLTAVKVSRCGKNLLPYPYYETTKTQNGVTFTDNGDGSITVNGTASKPSVFQFYSSVGGSKPMNLANKTITISGCPSGGSLQSYFLLFSYGGNSYQDLGNGITKTPDADITALQLRIAAGATVNNLTFRPQIELGTTATDYESYKECAEYTPTADGTVNGVTSLYPNTILMTDTNGVLIDCGYNRDINKAFAEMQAAIISMGGNI